MTAERAAALRRLAIRRLVAFLRDDTPHGGQPSVAEMWAGKAMPDRRQAAGPLHEQSAYARHGDQPET